MCIYYYENQNMTVTRIACRIVSNQANETILAWFKRRESQVFKDSQNIKFAAFDGKIHWYWFNMCCFDNYFHHVNLCYKKRNNQAFFVQG